MIIRKVRSVLRKIWQDFTSPYDPNRQECRSCRYWDDSQFGGICINPKSKEWQQLTAVSHVCQEWEKYQNTVRERP